MKRQKRKWSCATATVRNTLRAFGIYVAEHDIWPIAGLTQERGANEFGILDALRHFGVTAVEHRFNDRDEAWKWLHKTLQSGKFVILGVENWEHWVVALGSAGPSGVAIFDSSNFQNNTYENGTWVWKRRKLMYKWWNDRVHLGEGEGEDRLYAISVGKK